MTHNNDQTPLEMLTAPSARPTIIAETVSDRMTDAVAASQNGSLAVVQVTGALGRSSGRGKVVEVCQRATLHCSAIPGGLVWNGPGHQECPVADCGPLPRERTPGSAVSLDPAWSPDGNILAYVKSPESATGGNPPLAWYQAHQLFIFDQHTNTSTKVADISGVSVPTWSRNGTRLLYVSNDELWLWPLNGMTPVEIAVPSRGLVVDQSMPVSARSASGRLRPQELYVFIALVTSSRRMPWADWLEMLSSPDCANLSRRAIRERRVECTP